MYALRSEGSLPNAMNLIAAAAICDTDVESGSVPSPCAVSTTELVNKTTTRRAASLQRRNPPQHVAVATVGACVARHLAHCSNVGPAAWLSALEDVCILPY